MVLETTVICIDNSEWSRNADYTPSRFAAQQDCANLICGLKMQLNPENALGVLTMANDRVDLRAAPTDDIGKILEGLHDVTLSGVCDFVRGIQTAQLALKHRMNKNQRQRIIVFVCSPVEANDKQLRDIGKLLKKNTVALDIISFGEVKENSEKLQNLFNAVNSCDMSHIVECPQGAGTLSNIVMSSSILLGEGGEPVNSNEIDSNAVESSLGFAGVDPSSDPELYAALRMSLVDEQNRRQRENVTTAGSSEIAVPPVSSSADGGQPSENVEGRTVIDTIPTAAAIEMMEDIDSELRQALLMSVQDYHRLTARDDILDQDVSSANADLISAVQTEQALLNEQQLPLASASDTVDTTGNISECDATGNSTRQTEAAESDDVKNVVEEPNNNSNESATKEKTEDVQ